MHLLTPFTTLLCGLSYWKVKLSTGKEISEHQLSFDLLRGKRNVDWALDIVGSGDSGKITEMILCTPQGDAHMPLVEPFTALQLKRGTQDLFGGQKTIMAQIIGRVDDRETGACTACIWDVLEQKLYTDFVTNVHAFGAWREGITAPGALSADVIGFRLI